MTNRDGAECGGRQEASFSAAAAHKKAPSSAGSSGSRGFSIGVSNGVKSQNIINTCLDTSSTL
ncbi:MAG: hypothetical protein ACTIC1_02005, partial [Brevibacterium sp.]